MAAHKDHESGVNQLHRLLLLAVPEDRAGKKSVTNLARLMGLTRSSVWKWVRKEHVPPKRAAQIVDLSEGRVTLSDFSRFIYNL